MRLELLMSTHKSHFAYRLAWENTSQQRIPFLPLHRRDLVSADEGNRTYLEGDGAGAGERINWNKFAVMGEVVGVIVKSQMMPYTDLQRSRAVERLVVESVVCMNDDVSFASSPFPSALLLHQTCTLLVCAFLWVGFLTVAALREALRNSCALRRLRRDPTIPTPTPSQTLPIHSIPRRRERASERPGREVDKYVAVCRRQLAQRAGMRLRQIFIPPYEGLSGALCLHPPLSPSTTPLEHLLRFTRE